MKIHVTLLGGQTLPLYYPIKQYKPDKVYIIGTEDNLEKAERLKKLLTEGYESIIGKMNPICEEGSVTVLISSPYEQATTRILCEAIHENNPDVNAEEITYNVTGGTKVMTIAAVEVAKKHNASIIYTDSKFIRQISDDNIDPQPLNCDIRTPEIISLQGQKIKNADRFDKEKDKTEILAAQKVFDFWKQSNQIFHALRDSLFGNRGNDNIAIPNNYKFKVKTTEYNLVCTKTGKKGPYRLSLKDSSGKEYLDITCKDPKSMLLRGVWWEVLVANAISLKFPDYPVWMNVEFNPMVENNKNNVKNEVDVLVNIGNKLLFVECKSGKFDNSVINKMNTVRRTFGGDKSKSVLVSATNTDSMQYEHIHENADDNNIEIISPKKERANNEFLSKIPNKIGEFLNKKTT